MDSWKVQPNSRVFSLSLSLPLSFSLSLFPSLSLTYTHTHTHTHTIFRTVTQQRISLQDLLNMNRSSFSGSNLYLTNHLEFHSFLGGGEPRFN